MSKIKWGILGCGGIAQKFAQALQHTEDAVLYAAAARDGKRAVKFAQQWGFEKAVEGYRNLVADPEVDIIYIATPHSFHYAHARLCLEAGKHVLCEKPFTINTGQLQELIRLARDQKLFLMEALWTRFLPGINKVKELIEEGVIGEPVILNADFGIHFPYDPNHRLYDPLLAGGALLDIGIYPLFLSLYLFGEPVIIKAHAVLDDNKTDRTISIITQSKNGATGNLDATTRANTPIKARISGTKGYIELDRMWFTPVDITLRVDGEEAKVLEFPPVANGYEYEAMEATRCVKEGLSESKVMPFEFSIMLMEQLDKIREITGIRYPDKIESIETPFGWNEL